MSLLGLLTVIVEEACRNAVEIKKKIKKREREREKKKNVEREQQNEDEKMHPLPKKKKLDRGRPSGRKCRPVLMEISEDGIYQVSRS